MNNYSGYYETLIKPEFFPPDFVFGLAWAIIYPLIAVAAIYMSYLIYKDKLPVSLITLFVLNMVSNVLFTPIQFGIQNNLLAMIDIFIVCNPDVILEEEQLFSMLKNFIIKKREFSNVTCYYDREKKILSNPDRHFPCFLNFVFSIAFQKRFHYGTNTNVINPEWISGEFFLITANTYKKLNGFDDDYFMYVEDIDLCYRAKKLGITIFHDKEFYIIHETQMASRNLLSSSFKMHLSSVFRYLVKNKIFCLLKKVP